MTMGIKPITIARIIEKLDCEYIDVYLIHWPGTYGVSSTSPENARLRDISWQQMVKGVENGLVKILVSPITMFVN